MNGFEVPEPILNSPYEEPASHWYIVEGETPERRSGRRPSSYQYRAPSLSGADQKTETAATTIELKLVNRIRGKVKEWRDAGYPDVESTTLELLQYWRREGRRHRLFFAQLEAVETIIFLVEARADFRQGLHVPLDEPGQDTKEKGVTAFLRYACKMATGAGKTTVMAMIAAWSILNKVGRKSDPRFSDTVLVVCPNITIRDRLQELDPLKGETSIYRTRDLIPREDAYLTALQKGRVIITNWHVFEPQAMQVGGTRSKVARQGVPIVTRELIHIGPKSTSARGKRYLSFEDYRRQADNGMIDVLSEDRDSEGHLTKAVVEARKYVESDAAIIARVLGRAVGGKRNILVFNDEAHHAYRIRRPEAGEEELELFGEEEERDEFFREANVWMEGLDRVHTHRRINFCVDLSATPYFLARVGQQTNRPFPWIVSDFGLTDAIESGLVKIPQLAVRDSSGQNIPGYFNIWRWILPQLTPAERGQKRESPKPEAILKYAYTPIAMLAGLWLELKTVWEQSKDDPRPPVFIIVCKNTKIAKVVYEWIAENKPPHGIPPFGIAEFQNNGLVRTLRVDTKVAYDSESEHSKSDDVAWMRISLNTVGKTQWELDALGRSVYPADFLELAEKRHAPRTPPGRDIRCIVSVSMLTEGWDCNTVTHILGLRPFMSQLLCEQVVGRGLRRTNYDVDDNGLLREEVAKIFGVPFETIPFKANPAGPQPPPEKRHHVHAIPERSYFEIFFPRVEGYRQAIRNRVILDPSVSGLIIDPTNIPVDVEMKASLPSNQGRPCLTGPGKLVHVDMNPYRETRRRQELEFELAGDLTRLYSQSDGCEAPAQMLFPQFLVFVKQYIQQKVVCLPPAKVQDAFLSPYYGWMLERLSSAVRADIDQGEVPELPRFESLRGPGSTRGVDLWTSRPVFQTSKSHVNYVIADTKSWEQSASYFIDTHDGVDAFVKNAGLGFSIPYINNGAPHDYIPDFIVRLRDRNSTHLILETKGYDTLMDVKKQAAERWVLAVNADGRHGRWAYAMVLKPGDVKQCIDSFLDHP